MDEVIPDRVEWFLLEKADAWGSWALVVGVLVGVIVWQHLLYRARLQAITEQIAAEKAERLEAQQHAFQIMREQTEKHIKVLQRVETVVEFLKGQHGA